jgi:hypothetical protein
MKRKNNTPAVKTSAFIIPCSVFDISCLKFIVPLFLFLISFPAFSQEACNCPGGGKKGKGIFYAAWGYNRDWFSPSDLHFQNSGSDNYDFTLYNVKAKDRSGFSQLLKTAAHGDITIPQYVYRLGYYFNNKHDLGIEINFDHAKYVMIGGQTVHITGQIHGVEIDKDTVLGSDFLKFEHTNGANFLMGNFIKRKNFMHSENNKHWLSAILKTGAGIMIPKTDVTLFGTRIDNKFHIGGWLTGVETGFRYDGFRHFFMEATAKGSFVDYTDVLTVGTGRANHSFWCFEAILCAGFQFGW